MRAAWYRETPDMFLSRLSMGARVGLSLAFMALVTAVTMAVVFTLYMDRLIATAEEKELEASYDRVLHAAAVEADR
ncbi:MAG: hypothetical protein K2Q10_01390, partial [Rhodospirillales bacterium]|nr:hypothetical protein [Rhodospirillales bacterium]